MENLLGFVYNVNTVKWVFYRRGSKEGLGSRQCIFKIFLNLILISLSEPIVFVIKNSYIISAYLYLWYGFHFASFIIFNVFYLTVLTLLLISTISHI